MKKDPDLVEIEEDFTGGHKKATERLNKVKRCVNALVRAKDAKDGDTIVRVAGSLQGLPAVLNVRAQGTWELL